MWNEGKKTRKEGVKRVILNLYQKLFKEKDFLIVLAHLHLRTDLFYRKNTIWSYRKNNSNNPTLL